MHTRSWLFAVLFATAVLGQGYGGGPPPSSNSGPGGGNDGGGDAPDNDSTQSPSPTATSSSAASTNTAPAINGTGFTGSTTCFGPGLLCITAIVDPSSNTTTYELASQATIPVGWMAMGFGKQMANSPMVIMWANSDGSITLSQRQAPAEVMPTLVSNPPRLATLSTNNSNALAAQPTFAYTIPSTGETTQDIIWAFGNVHPGSSDKAAVLTQHLNSGPAQIDLSQPIASGSSPNANNAVEPPLLPYEKLIVAHAIVCAFAFLFLLPAGALFARWLRTTTISWFRGHWLIQFSLSGPAVVIGVGLGIAAVKKHGSVQLGDRHKILGIVLLVLYLAQCSLGAFIHFVKNPNRTARPPQNYLHAIFGLSIIGLALYQVRRGYSYEWAFATGRGDLPKGVNVVWYIWVVLLPVLYFSGLSLLPRQYRQEKEALRNRMAPSKMATFRSYSGNPYSPIHADSSVALPVEYRGRMNA